MEPVATQDRKSSTDSTSRTRTWSADVQKYWNLPVPDVETVDQRLARYTEYFMMKDEQVNYVCTSLTNAIKKNVQMAKVGGGQELKMLDTCVSSLPTGNETGVVYTVEFSSSHVRAVRCRLDGSRNITTSEHRMQHSGVGDCAGLVKGLLDANCGAMELFNTIADCLKSIMESSGDLRRSGSNPIPVAFVVSFPCVQKGVRNANLLNWTKGFETGRNTQDPVEGLDMATLLDMAFWRKDINARCVTVLNDGTAALLAAEYERNPKLPPCVAAYLVSVGVNGLYVEPNYHQYKYEGCIINTELGDFDQSLPMTDVDLEVDFADQGGRGQQLFEKMAGGGYLGELCRRLVVKVYQNEAPTLAWARQSLPTAAAALCVADNSNDLSRMATVLKGAWGWDCDKQTLLNIKDMFKLVFDRSAALSAAAIGALAKSTGRLQPAMGGVTVALESGLHANHPWYTELIRQRLTILLKENASLVNLYVIHDATAKGAAVLATMSVNSRN